VFPPPPSWAILGFPAACPDCPGPVGTTSPEAAPAAWRLAVDHLYILYLIMYISKNLWMKYEMKYYEDWILIVNDYDIFIIIYYSLLCIIIHYIYIQQNSPLTWICWRNQIIMITGWWLENHLEKWWSSSMGRMTTHILWKIKAMFQTTNQIKYISKNLYGWNEILNMKIEYWLWMIMIYINYDVSV
jgi:hypothetical protein